MTMLLTGLGSTSTFMGAFQLHSLEVQETGSPCSLREPVCKNQTYCGKGGKFDFFHILMLERLGYNLNHCIVFSVKYPFISEINANNHLRRSIMT